MMILTVLLWLMISITGVQVCTVPSLALDCSNRQNVRVTWNEDCVISCDVIWNCTNGEDVLVKQRQSCATTWTNFNIQWESYVCNVTMNYWYINKSFQWFSGKASRSCSAFTCNIQPVDKMLVGHPQKIRCLVDTPDITNPDNVNISWTGPNGAIGNTGRLRINPTFSNGTDHISTLEFSELNEEDEGLYECNTTVLGYEENKTALINLTNLTLKDDGPKDKYFIEINTILAVDANTFAADTQPEAPVIMNQTVIIKKHLP